MSAARRVLGLLVAGAGIAALGALTRLPYATRETGAVLRLSWRVRGEEEEQCRRATAAELANLPAHMRQAVVCEEGRVAPYRLRVALDGRPVIDERPPGSDVRGDRPMFLLRDLPLAPGAHRVQVLLERVGAASAAGDTLEEREHRRRAIPPRLVLDTTVRAAPQAILLVTYSSELRRLVLLAPGGGGSAR